MGSPERFRLTNGPSGCLLLFSQGKVVYVCASGNVFARMATLWQAQSRMRRGKVQRSPWEPAMEFDAVEFSLMPESLAEREAVLLITRYQPKYNDIVVERETLTPGLEKSDLFKGLQRLRKEHGREVQEQG